MNPMTTIPNTSGYATLADLQAWAASLMTRAPDYTIFTRAGTDYLRRWWVIPRSQQCNVYLHEIVASDDDRALHDHPWDSTSMIIEGGYIEHTPEGRFPRSAGDVVSRKATDAHRLEIPEGGRCVSLFITGPKVRDWGFHCPNGFVLWSDFVDDADSGKIGKGCEG